MGRLQRTARLHSTDVACRHSVMRPTVAYLYSNRCGPLNRRRRAARSESALARTMQRQGRVGVRSRGSGGWPDFGVGCRLGGEPD
jgi:hypothetical protein